MAREPVKAKSPVGWLVSWAQCDRTLFGNAMPEFPLPPMAGSLEGWVNDLCRQDACLAFAVLGVVGEVLRDELVRGGDAAGIEDVLDGTITRLWHPFRTGEYAVPMGGGSDRVVDRERQAGFRVPLAASEAERRHLRAVHRAFRWFRTMILWVRLSYAAGTPPFSAVGVRMWLDQAAGTIDQFRGRRAGRRVIRERIRQRFPFEEGLSTQVSGRTVGGRQHDLANILLAHGIVEDMQRWFDANVDWRSRFRSIRPDINGHAVSGYVAQMNRMSGRMPNVPLFLLLVARDAPVQSGYGHAAENGVIVIRALDERGIRNPHLGTWLTVGRRDMLEHEITHYLDDVRGVGKSIKTIQAETLEGLQRGEQAGLAAYYNHPLELNAFFQEGAGTIVSILRKYHEGEHYADIPLQHRDPEHEAQMARKVWGVFAGSPQVFHRRFWSSVDKDFVAHLTPANRQRLDKRIYQLYQAIQQYRPALV